MTANLTANSTKKTAIIVGALFLIAMATSLIGGAMLIETAIGADDYLVTLAEKETEVILGVLMELVNVICVVLIGVLMFPIFKRHDEALALGYVAMRIIEGAVIVAGIVSPLTLVALSVEYVEAGAPDVAYFQTIGETLLATRAVWAGLLLGLFFSLGALFFYYLLYKTQLVPRFISIWGFIGAALILGWNLFDLFGIDAGMVLALPIILNEIFLAIWLIIKGFDANAIAALNE